MPVFGLAFGRPIGYITWLGSYVPAMGRPFEARVSLGRLLMLSDATSFCFLGGFPQGAPSRPQVFTFRRGRLEYRFRSYFVAYFLPVSLWRRIEHVRSFYATSSRLRSRLIGVASGYCGVGGA